MKTIQLNLYEFAELDANGRKKALEEFTEINTFWGWWDFIYDDFVAITETLGITVNREKVYFNGFYSQGNGSAFEAQVNLPVLLQGAKTESWRNYAPKLDLGLPVYEADRRIVRLITNESIDLSPRIFQPTRSYYVRGELNWQAPYNNHVFDRIETELEKLEEWLKEVGNNLNRFLYKSLQDEYEYQTSDKAIADGIEANEYHFTADGKSASRIEKLIQRNTQN